MRMVVDKPNPPVFSHRFQAIFNSSAFSELTEHTESKMIIFYEWTAATFCIRTNRTNGRVECTLTQPEADRNILSPHYEMHFTNGIPIDKCYSIGTNRTSGRVQCIPTQPEANGNIVSPRNEMHFTNAIPVE